MIHRLRHDQELRQRGHNMAHQMVAELEVKEHDHYIRRYDLSYDHAMRDWEPEYGACPGSARRIQVRACGGLVNIAPFCVTTTSLGSHLALALGLA